MNPLFRALILLLFLCAFSVRAQTPEWIWAGPAGTAETVYLRKSFRTPPYLWISRLTVSADDQSEIFLNGVSIAQCERWDEPVRTEVTVRLNQGDNVIGVRARNESGAAGVLVHLSLLAETNIVSDASWLVSSGAEEAGWSTVSFNAAHWKPARSLGAHGMPPWGDVLQKAAATSASSLEVPDGFKVELLRSAESGEGSWVCLTFDAKGRLIVSPEGRKDPLLRLTLAGGRVERIEPVPAPLRFAMGLLYAHDSLYANAIGPSGAGLYRLVDANGNDQFEEEELRLLKKFEGGSEHGYHAVRLGPEGDIYVLNGNGTKLPPGLSRESPHKNFREDFLTHGAGSDSGGEPYAAGYVLKTDREGRDWKLWLGGLRNSYGFDFNPDGELFVFDSEMEWDWGTPWYRPARILHAVSGGEYGWREDARMWPDYYEDSLPAVVNVGIGSPTGVRFGTGSHFPEKYQRALFAMDWSYGRLFAVHLQPSGASYQGQVETFLRGQPLNLTDLAFGPDGALYFITGGRGTQSGLYRVSYTGAGSAEQVSAIQGTRATADAPGRARELRREIERRQGRREAGAVEFLWPHLGNADRFIRYAARVALEAQEVSIWKKRALEERDPLTGLTALLALARVGSADLQRDLLESVEELPLSSLTEEQQLLKLRVLQLSILRQGTPPPDLAALIVEKLGAAYPAQSGRLNRELSRLLIRLEAPGVVGKSLDLLFGAVRQEDQFHYITELRHLRRGWTGDDRRRYFSWWSQPRDRAVHSPEVIQWFADARRDYVDGAWFDKYLAEFRADAIATLSAAEKARLGSVLDAPLRKAHLVPARQRSFVRDWTASDLLSELPKAGAGRNFEKGRQAFADAQCLICHKFGNDGGSLGPELTASGSKYDRRTLMESLLEPSKVINEQYQGRTIVLKDGERHTGQILREAGDEIVLQLDAIARTEMKIPREKVQEIRPAAISSMPEGLLNVLEKEEILDLLAYLESGGNAGAAAFWAGK